MIDQSSAPSMASLTMASSAEQPVEGDHVDGHQDEADEAGDQAGVQGVAAERGRHDLRLLLLELDGQRAVLQRRGEVLGLALGEAARDLDLVGWKRRPR